MLKRAGGPFLIALALLAACCGAASAATIVQNTSDSGAGSLRAAIAGAPAGETIIVPAGTYTLNSELVIDKSLTIMGAGTSGPAATTISGKGAVRVFHVEGASSDVTISDLEVTEGLAPVEGNDAKGGGLVLEKGHLLLEGDLITHNRAINDATKKGEAGRGAEGGGLVNEQGSLEVVDCTFTANLVRAQGGEEAEGGDVLGGGLSSVGALQVRGSVFDEDEAIAEGGQGPSNAKQGGGNAEGAGVYALIEEGEGASLDGIALEHDKADAAGGPGGGGGGALGGGIFIVSTGPAFAIQGLTAAFDEALAPGGFGLAESGGVYAGYNSAAGGSLTDATVVGDLADAEGAGGAGEGGGLMAFGSAETPFQLANDTIDGDTVQGAGAGTGGGDLYADNHVSVLNTIVSGGSAPDGRANCDSATESLGHNIDSADECGFHSSGDHVDSDPRLGGLGGVGGGLLTQPPLSGSPAIDGGSNNGCPAIDARGVARPEGGGCDIGAYELAPPAVTTLPAGEVTQTSATLLGTARNPDLSEGVAEVQFGTTTAYGTTTELSRLAGISPVFGSATVAPGAEHSLSLALTGLTPGTTYHYRLVGIDPDGVSDGADESFTTQPAATKALPPRLLSGLHITPSRLRAARGRGASFGPSPKGTGATLSYTLGEGASALVTIRVLRGERGFRSGSGCVARRPRRGPARHCTRFVALAPLLLHRTRAGAGSHHMTGRFNGRPLAPGAYRLRVGARAAAGGGAVAFASVSFTVVR